VARFSDQTMEVVCVLSGDEICIVQHTEISNGLLQLINSNTTRSTVDGTSCQTVG